GGLGGKRAEKLRNTPPADFHRVPLRAGGRTKGKKRLNFFPTRPNPPPAGKPPPPPPPPQLYHRVRRHKTGSDHRPHRRTGGAERGDRPQPADQDDVQREVQRRHDDAEDHWRARVARRSQRAAEHVEDEHAAAEEKRDAEERQRFRLHFGRGVDQIEQRRREDVP